MLPLVYVGRWRVAGVFMLAGVLAMTLMPVVLLDMRMRQLASYDKLAHGLAFLILAVWFSGQYARRSYLNVALGLLAFGAFIEICQYFTRYRSADWMDLLADLVGIVIGLMIAVAGAGGWSLRAERWLLARRQAS
jgi:VanZ like family